MNQKQATHIKTIKKSDYRRDNQTSWLASKRLTSSVTLWLLVPTFDMQAADTAKFIDNVQQALITEKQT